MSEQANKFIRFEASIADHALPKTFASPFENKPHSLCLLATKQLQEHLTNQTEWEHNFGLNPDQEGQIIGKMFGVLVVQNQAGETGFLAAFSGKLADGNHHSMFVPPVFDMLKEGGWFNEGMKALGRINTKVWALEKSDEFVAGVKFLTGQSLRVGSELNELLDKEQRLVNTRESRLTDAAATFSADAFATLEEDLRQDRAQEIALFKHLAKKCKQQLLEAKERFNKEHSEVIQLKVDRKAKSGELQQAIFEAYNFLNQQAEEKSLLDIFSQTPQKKPPAGAGECAAPKLLQYAFLHKMKPIAMAEFWWGLSPKSDQWKHKDFYPACTSKCKPILEHMLG
jgi:tRNA pseudouridine32 synthase/23S rRNA pseudouridine746 synthase